MNPGTYEQLLLKLGPIGLTFVLVIALGYVIRFIPLKINWLIPVVIPPAAGAVLLGIAPKGFAGDGWNHPGLVVFIYGFIVGVAAWAVHALIIARIEDKIREKFPSVDKLFTATSDQPKPPPLDVPPQDHDHGQV